MTAFEFLFQTCLAGSDILLPTLLFEPRTDFRFGFVGLDNSQPCPIRALVGVFAGEDFTNFSGLQLIIQRHHFTVHLAANGLVSDLRMDPIGKVNYRCTHRQGNGISAGCHDHNIFR